MSTSASTKILPLMVTLFLIWEGSAVATTPVSASFLPWSSHHGTHYVYFGVENNGEISSFGGSIERQDHDSPMHAAAREGAEEAIGVFGDTQRILSILRDWQNNGTQRMTNHSGTHVLYYAPVHTTGNPMREFARRRSQPNLPHTSREMSQIVAIPLTDLHQALQQNTGTLAGRHVRRHIWSTLRNGYNNGQI